AGVQIALALGLAAFIAVYLFSGQIARHVFYIPGLAEPLRMISFLLPFTIYSGIVGGVLIGKGFIIQKIFNDLLTPVFYMLLIFAVLLFHLHFRGIIFAYAAASLAIALLIIALGFRKLGGAPLLPLTKQGGAPGGRPRTDYKNRYAELLKFSVPLLVATITTMVIMWTDTLMVGRYINAQAVGTYSVSVSLVNLLLFPLTALGYVFLPIAGELYANDRTGNGSPHDHDGLRDLKRAYQVLTKWVFAVTLPLFFVLFFFPQMSITALFGARFVDASVPLRFLAFGLMINAFLGTNGMLMMVMGLSRDIMNISITGAAFNIVLNYVLIKKIGLGLAGAAASTMSSYILINVLYSFSLYRKSGLHPFSPSYLKPLAGAAVSALAIYAVAKSLPLSFWMLPVYFLLFIGGYGASLLLTKSIEAEDLYMMERVFGRLGVRPRRLMGLLSKVSSPEVEKPDAGMR
ncbi:MAG: polysaccharide biosynthesis C-terminal domain-containing protein, partial [Nitrospiraceae bacterium]|nr:polysaccharide biosynthesis C-terminal domain-containing protein [Nitrospiraceae bacterium]